MAGRTAEEYMAAIAACKQTLQEMADVVAKKLALVGTATVHMPLAKLDDILYEGSQFHVNDEPVFLLDGQDNAANIKE